MTALKDILLRQIDRTGPMTVADYMATCLLHPEHGYYTTRDPLGAAGDFTTAPEISQMFGELVGLWLAQLWLSDGAPAPFTLTELGPGRGTLMADILRAAAKVPGFTHAAELYLLEASPALRDIQRDTLSGYTPTWISALADLPARAPLYVVANEFFDALPIRQHQRAGGYWRERLVGADGDMLELGLGPEGDNPLLTARFPNLTDGTVVETCPPGEAMAADLGSKIGALGGAALVIDYGDWDGSGDTFQALKDHTHVDPLEAPGSADLTAHVGFRWLAEASGLQAAFTTQGAFLERLGITARANALARRDPEGIAGQHRRLTHPEEMGSLFKVMALRAGANFEAPGFA